VTAVDSPRPDRALLKSGGNTRDIAIAEFMNMPIDKQMELLLQGQITFFAGKTQLRTLDALRVLREERARQVTRDGKTE
jgi:hypothetical protein